MDMMKALFPVLSMMLIGMFCRKSGLISEKGIQDLKTLMTQIILPVAVFNALATAEYGVHLFGLVGLMLVFMILPFLLGLSPAEGDASTLQPLCPFHGGGI